MKLGIYEHNSGKLYQALGICRHSETLEEMVVYQSLYNDFALWIRPKDMFFSMIEKDGQTIPRFKFIRDNLTTPAILR